MSNAPDDDDEEETIPSPEDLLASLRSEESALARIVNAAGPDTRRIANFLEGTVFPLMRDTLRAMVVQSSDIEDIEDIVYARSTIQAPDAAKIHTLLDKTHALFESGAKDMLTLTERDAFGALLGEVRRLVIRAEEDGPDEDEEDDDSDEAAIENAPEIPRASDSP
jgi:hypothetical protein